MKKARRRRWRRRWRWVFVSISVGVLLFVALLGFSKEAYTSRFDGQRRFVRKVYIPFWLYPDSAWVISYTENQPTTATSVFLRLYGNIVKYSEKEWFADSINQSSLLGYIASYTTREPGRYVLFPSFSYEESGQSSLYGFLLFRQTQDTNFVDTVGLFFQDPKAEWVENWKKELNAAYFRYSLDLPESPECNAPH